MPPSARRRRTRRTRAGRHPCPVEISAGRVCGRPTKHEACAEHAGQTMRARRSSALWRTTARTAVARHLEQVGPVCPGWERPAHVVDPGDLTADHVDPAGPDTLANAAVLCRPCNAAKGDSRDHL